MKFPSFLCLCLLECALLLFAVFISIIVFIRCFMDYFKRYVISKNKEFPVPFSQFDALVHE